ncbi:MAG TPA: FAD:protein FMN transferase [Pseudonocardia sp.]|nr:FAD:protein FMN transferase [Pseudonocardia sp.]
MTVPTRAPGRCEFTALGTTALLLVTEADRLEPAERALRAELRSIDETCSRFRPDSEISRLHQRPGSPVTVSPLLAEALDAAFSAAELTDGLVDPTVGRAVRELGYDQDFAQVRDLPADPTSPPAPGWWRVRWDPERREVLLPRSIELDLGATAKALAADRAARQAASVAGCGVLVSLGGDLALAGDPPEGGWLVAIGDDHRNAAEHPEQTVSLRTGALATSSTTVRTWRAGASQRHHIVDPRTGTNPEPVWRTVSVAAASCVDANTASTASIVLGQDAPAWLAARGLPARLVAPDGSVVFTPSWPTTREHTPLEKGQ